MTTFILHETVFRISFKNSKTERHSYNLLKIILQIRIVWQRQAFSMKTQQSVASDDFSPAIKQKNILKNNLTALSTYNPH